MIPNTMFRPTVVTMMKKVRSKMVRGMYTPKLLTRASLSSLKIGSPFCTAVNSSEKSTQLTHYNMYSITQSHEGLRTKKYTFTVHNNESMHANYMHT